MIVKDRNQPPPKKTTFAQIAVGEAFFIFNHELYFKLSEIQRRDGTSRNAAMLKNGEEGFFKPEREVLLVEAEVSYKILRKEEGSF